LARNYNRFIIRPLQLKCLRPISRSFPRIYFSRFCNHKWRNLPTSHQIYLFLLLFRRNLFLTHIHARARVVQQLFLPSVRNTDICQRCVYHETVLLLVPTTIIPQKCVIIMYENEDFPRTFVFQKLLKPISVANRVYRLETRSMLTLI